MIDCFVGLGGNIGDTFSVMEKTLHAIAAISTVQKLVTSRVFLTTAVSDLPQDNYLNAVCRFQTTLPPLELFEELELIEKKMGKNSKPKNAPRVIDLDLIFYGNVVHTSDRLKLPHPCWQDRLFVVAPLADLVKQDFFFDPSGVLNYLQTTSKEKVVPLTRSLPFHIFRSA